MIRSGHGESLGATADSEGTNFAVFSSVATAVELCLFDPSGRQSASFELPGCSDDIWHGYLPCCQPGQRYGYRVHGPYDPDAGLRCNPAKLLIDPYAKALDSDFRWHDSMFDHCRGERPTVATIDTRDSADFVPKSLVCDSAIASPPLKATVARTDSVLYEANIRGFTMRHPAVADADKGRFTGMGSDHVVEYLKALGITSLELMPVHAFMDERHLDERGLRNFWGYNPVCFFAPANRYEKHDAVAEFRKMVRSFHNAGIEVILDVVYNHSAEAGTDGPTLCFRGLDNLAYYRTEASNPDSYVNDTGCGNTLNSNHPIVQRMVVDSLRYWHQELGVDGFRFDLAPVLGRHRSGFSATHEMLNRISSEPQLANAKLIAEPWDPGPGGYQLGAFPQRWGEWNDRFRDTARDYWRGNTQVLTDLAKRLHGSADIFESSCRGPHSSINFVTCHDGFTLNDVVSYEQRHNEANGESNRDGHSHNYSCNHGVEGPSADNTVNRQRRQHRLNLFATLLFSQGTPLILAGDEFGQTQNGNNNAYAQDNDTAWLNWNLIDEDPKFTSQITKLIRLRRENPLLRLDTYLHGTHRDANGVVSLFWLRADGQPMEEGDWECGAAVCKVLRDDRDDGESSATAILINGSSADLSFNLKQSNMAGWIVGFSSSDSISVDQQVAIVPRDTMALLVSNRSAASEQGIQ